MDCYPSSSCGVVYLDEGAVVREDDAAGRRLEKVSKVDLTSGSVLSLCTLVDLVFHFVCISFSCKCSLP